MSFIVDFKSNMSANPVAQLLVNNDGNGVLNWTKEYSNIPAGASVRSVCGCKKIDASEVIASLNILPSTKMETIIGLVT